MKENQQTHLLSNRFYLTINKIGEKQLVLPLWSHRLVWSFYFTVLSRVWQCSMGWFGTHISLPTAGVAGLCYHTWLFKDAMPFKIHSRAANWEYGEDIDWLLDVSPFQMCHHFRPITGSTIKATPDWKGSVTHSTGYTAVMLKEARGNQCALSNQLPGVWALLVASVGNMTQMPKCPTTMENTHGNILMWLTKQKTVLCC